MVSAWWPSGGGRRIHTGIVTGRWMTKKKRKEKKVPRFRVLVWTHWGSRVRFFFFVCVWSRPFLRPFSLWTCRLPCFLVFFSRDRCWSPFSFQVTRWRQKKNSKRQCDKKKSTTRAAHKGHVRRRPIGLVFRYPMGRRKPSRKPSRTRGNLLDQWEFAGHARYKK